MHHIATKELHLRTWASAQHIHSQKELLLSVLSVSNICFLSSRWQGISFIDQDHISQTVLWSSYKKKKSIRQYDCKTTNLFLICWDNEIIIFSHLGKVYNMPFNNCIMWQWLISLRLLLHSLLLAAASSPINTGDCWYDFCGRLPNKEWRTRTYKLKSVRYWKILLLLLKIILKFMLHICINTLIFKKHY